MAKRNRPFVSIAVTVIGWSPSPLSPSRSIPHVRHFLPPVFLLSLLDYSRLKKAYSDRKNLEMICVDHRGQPFTTLAYCRRTMARRLKGVYGSQPYGEAACSLLLFKTPIGLEELPRWLIRHGLKALPVSAGRTGMGASGSAHPAWEVTAACNSLRRICHPAEGGRQKTSFPPDEAKRFHRISLAQAMNSNAV